MNKLISSVSPHFSSNITTTKIMLDVIIALMPAAIASVVIFGLRSLLVIGVCVAVCIFAEWGFEKICKKKNTITDLSAVVTGMILAFNLPVSIPLWQAAFGSIVAIVVVKQLFGGIGQNFANPAITARIVMMTAFSGTMTSWVFPDASSSATPLALIAKGQTEGLPSYLNMFLGMRGGCLGETCALALLLGGIYLIVRRVISWHTPVAFIGTVAVMSLICGKDVLYQLMAGGLLLGAIFMATDYSSTPATKSGKLIFGVGCGLITVLIRFWGNFPEGVSFSILIMNILTPYIERLTRAKPLVGGDKA
ncbi:MAG: RnfABCDGE type electron transport complex subunit D [Ruminococcus sp.]|jgi:electron transport complex protein RnfD|nr:RnfABCDGE type electron transport complex subunit D [Ruminococcus sp.]